MNKIEKEILAQKLVIANLSKDLCYSPLLKNQGSNVVTGSKEADAIIAGAEKLPGYGIYLTQDGSIVRAHTNQYLTVTEPGTTIWETLIAAVNEIALLERAVLEKVDVVEEALKHSKKTGVPRIVNFNSVVAIRCDDTSETVTFAFYSMAGYGDDAMSKNGSILHALADHNSNEKTFNSGDRTGIDSMAKKLNIKLTKEVVKK